ncbi:uncharacterized protein PGTG_12304 [Puccinia graminis f. sp. tritici CRL 75-36-700-3]|uniref:Uncharacterized protein n=1 Tax=Puccinia graminis f. sp. tritici (strain CRL 75-36-700-3 / race SCCL) TaxID=418459 RepID=E3KPW3_PUCGT|nr:uncharacterized protein PGTG_12304 [Puccinia graminis f. sp. tritici CRL 75-36-700-3]EFP86348.2 hypothetical protein PGTG_12304 [Puccinia graminis f. sp. tritici CRL 75-36-700-3]
MNPRQASLRSSNRASGSTSKRPLPDDTGDRKRKSQPRKRSKKPAQAQAPHTSEPDILPTYEVLWKSSEASAYHRALLLKQSQKRELSDLDQSLSKTPFSRSEEEQSEDAKERLLRVLRWKLLRGRFRATLPALVSQNSTEDVERVVKNALEQLGSCQTIDQLLHSGALATMCELRGIGPATAAAFLSFEAPSLIAVFSDEAASFFENRLGLIKYTLPFYTSFVECMQAKLQELAKLDGSWDLRRLERALWTHQVLRKLLTDQEWTQFIHISDLQPEPSNSTA